VGSKQKMCFSRKGKNETSFVGGNLNKERLVGGPIKKDEFFPGEMRLAR